MEKSLGRKWAERWREEDIIPPLWVAEAAGEQRFKAVNLVERKNGE
jgi:hypothetical protein